MRGLGTRNEQRHVEATSEATPTQMESQLAPQIDWLTSFKNLILGTRLNLLLLLLPFALIIPHVQFAPGSEYIKACLVFVLNFLTIVPLAKLLGSVTEEIALRTSTVIGGLLNASFGNAVELIIAVIALNSGLVRVVQASLLGSILSNLLLVLGCCFLFGGLKYKEQFFNATSAQTASSMLALAVLSILIPATFDFTILTESKDDDTKILALSRGTSIIMLIVYVLYLVFQLKTHSYLYNETSQQVAQGYGQLGGQSETSLLQSPNPALPHVEEVEEPTMGLWPAVVALIIITIFVSLCADYLVGCIDKVSEITGWSDTFIGLIIVPIVGNAAEHVSAVSVSLKNKMDLAISVAIGSSTQVALLLTPFICIVGWIIDKPFTLDFHPFETVVLFMAILMVNYLIQDGKSHWLEGVMLIASYSIITLAFYLYPSSP